MSDRAYIDTVMKSGHRLTRRAVRHLYFETYAPVFALAAVLLIGFLIGSFSGLWERIGDPFRAFALMGVLVVLGRAIWHARQKRRPTQSMARRRVEHDSGASHRPLDTLHDQPAINSPSWSTHYERAVQAVHRLLPSKRRSTLSPIDPYFLRFLAPLILLFALAIGFGDNSERLRRSLTPIWQAGVNPANVSFEAWIDPPDYTGRPPIFFKGKDRIEIPAGSELVARLSGAQNAPRLKLTTDRASRYIRLTRLDAKTLEARTVLKSKAKARWRVGFKVQNWDLDVLEDTPPTVKFEDTPKADKRDRLVLNYSFDDDYGVESLALHMQILDDPDQNSQSENLKVENPTKIIPLSLQSRSVKRVEARESELDLTKHVWAGEKVSAVLVAHDGLGQEARSELKYFTVPDKIFIEQIAKAIVEHRSLVLQGKHPYAPLPKQKPRSGDLDWRNGFDTYEPDLRLNRAPHSVQKAALLIEAVTDTPAGLFEDPAVFMGLRNVLSRLRYADNQNDLEGIPEDLWSIAIRAEFGLLGTALQEMQEAEANLRDGIARRAPQREVDTLFDRYNEAVDNYMEELRKNATISQDDSGGGGGGKPRDMSEIEELLKAIEEANRIGDTEGARLALARLAELLEKMKIELTMGQGEGSGDSLPGEMSEEMLKALEEMADLLGEQRKLKDETEQAEDQQKAGKQIGEMPGAQSGQGEQAGSQGLSAEELAEQQDRLQEALEKLAEAVEGDGLGSTPMAGEDEKRDGKTGGGEGSEEESSKGLSANDALDQAERAMSDSANALSSDELQEAAEAQAQAIEALRNAGQALAEAAQSMAQSDQTGNAGANPLGQDNNGVNDDDFEAEVDTRDKATRSRELLEELRNRAAEQDRKKSERDYLERLLKRF